MTRTAALLTLFAALAWSKRHGAASQWTDARWRRLTVKWTPREIAVVALCGIRGLSQTRVRDWLGADFSRQMVSNIYREALARLARTLEQE